MKKTICGMITSTGVKGERQHCVIPVWKGSTPHDWHWVAARKISCDCKRVCKNPEHEVPIEEQDVRLAKSRKQARKPKVRVKK